MLRPPSKLWKNFSYFSASAKEPFREAFTLKQLSQSLVFYEASNCTNSGYLWHEDYSWGQCCLSRGLSNITNTYIHRDGNWIQTDPD
jgi:hypothetical protein